MKPDDYYESPEGHHFRILAFDARTITVEVERTVRKNGIHSEPITELRTRVMPNDKVRFQRFAAPYKKTKKP